jgi:hypothetical protein
MPNAADNVNTAGEAIKNASVAVALLEQFVRPMGRFVQRRTVSHRMGATDTFIDMAYDEIYNEEYEDFIPEDRRAQVLKELELFV